jgi:hypothetical protein
LALPTATSLTELFFGHWSLHCLELWRAERLKQLELRRTLRVLLPAGSLAAKNSVASGQCYDGTSPAASLRGRRANSRCPLPSSPDAAAPSAVAAPLIAVGAEIAAPTTEEDAAAERAIDAYFPHTRFYYCGERVIFGLVEVVEQLMCKNRRHRSSCAQAVLELEKVLAAL